MCIETEAFRILGIKWKIKCSKTKCIWHCILAMHIQVKNINISYL